jgi:hypothetical protein
MSTSKRERKRFERWYIRRCSTRNRSTKNPLERFTDHPEHGNDYFYEHARTAWSAWKASKRQRDNVIHTARTVASIAPGFDYSELEAAIRALSNELERYDHEGITNDAD